MSLAKKRIFERLAGCAFSGETSYPSYAHPHLGISDPRQGFKAVVEEVGGECCFAADPTEARILIEGLDVVRTSRLICSYVPEILAGNFDAEAKESARDCRDVGLTVVRGDLAVAENGAVWVDADRLRHRSLLFLSENLILVVAGKTIVPDLESAYARLDFSRLRSGYFISGPSKTADIEQCLVVGAHGARSLVVVIVG